MEDVAIYTKAELEVIKTVEEGNCQPLRGQPLRKKRFQQMAKNTPFKTKAIVKNLKKGDLIPFTRPIETKHK